MRPLGPVMGMKTSISGHVDETAIRAVPGSAGGKVPSSIAFTDREQH
jgi:hypothetical protein